MASRWARVIDAVVSLCDTVAQIGGKIAGGFAAVLVDRLHGLSYKLIEMRAAGMAVAKVLSTMIWGLLRSSIVHPMPIFSGSLSGASARTC